MKPLHEVASVETPEQLVLDLPLAGVGSRACAYLIDLLIQSVLVIAAGALALSTLSPLEAPAIGPDGRIDMEHVLVPVLVLQAVLFVVNFGYFAFFESFSNGRSPGKRAMSLRVMMDGGHPIHGRASLVRNFLRAVDSLPAAYLVGIIAVFCSREAKRIGDIAAGTIVVRDRKMARESAPVAGVGLLTPAETSLVQRFRERRADLDPVARRALCRQLAEGIARRMGRPVPDDPQRFLDEVWRG